MYFGNCALVQVKNDKYISLSNDLWLKIYEVLFGGFEDIENDKEDDDIDELENIKKEMKSKKGEYLKDGFVVDSDESDEVISNNSDEEELDIEVLDENTDDPTEEHLDLLDDSDLDISVGSELEEEEYEYSDDD